MKLYKNFVFDSAHFLPSVPDDHPCKQMHGHTYFVQVVLEGPLDPKLDWVMDFAEIKKLWDPIKQTLDHKLLNNVPGLSNPTAENIAIWIWKQLKPHIALLKSVEIKETPTSGVIYEGEPY